MPRKPKQEKQTVTVIVNGAPVAMILHPPTGSRRTWYVYWSGLAARKSTGQRKLEDAVVVAENMLKSGGKRATVESAFLSDEEFEEIQRIHYAKRKGEAAQVRAAKSLQSCLEAINAFKVIAKVHPISQATPDDCAAFQQKALTLPKSTLRPYPNGKEDVACYSPNTVVKWSVALQAAWERVCRTAGKKCVRGIVDESKLLTENPWRQFTWIEGYERPLRQFDGDELLGLLDYLDKKWPGVSVAPLMAKVLLWSCGRRAEVSSLTWQQVRIVGHEHHFQVIGKWGVKKWFRIPEGLYRELLAIRTDSSYVFAAYNDQLRQFHAQSPRPGAAKAVGAEFSPGCFGDWFHERLADWSHTLAKGHAYTHVFRKTSLQYARRGEDVAGRVASDAGVSKDVMMTHYVEVSDPELRGASNRTFERINASLPPIVALKYGHLEVPPDDVEQRLQAAMTNKDWPLVAVLSARLARKECSPTG